MEWSVIDRWRGWFSEFPGGSSRVLDAAEPEIREAYFGHTLEGVDFLGSDLWKRNQGMEAGSVSFYLVIEHTIAKGAKRVPIEFTIYRLQ